MNPGSAPRPIPPVNRVRRVVQTVLLFLALSSGAGIFFWLTEAPSRLLPKAPYWRWAAGIVIAGAASLLGEMWFEYLHAEVEATRGTRDLVVRFGVPILAALLTLALLAFVVFLWWWAAHTTDAIAV